MCHGHRHRSGRFRSRRYPNREQWLRSLEEYQKDLEQETVDVAELIRRLKEERPAQTVSV